MNESQRPFIFVESEGSITALIFVAVSSLLFFPVKLRHIAQIVLVMLLSCSLTLLLQEFVRVVYTDESDRETLHCVIMLLSRASSPFKLSDDKKLKSSSISPGVAGAGRRMYEPIL